MNRLNVCSLADNANFNRFHFKVLLWCFGILILDGYDLAVAGAALPAIMKPMKVEATAAGFMASSALFGMAFGAIILGTLSERIGRRRAVAISVLLFSVFTAGAGFTNEPVSFSIVRFIAGLGIGGAIPNVTAQMAEYAPKKFRGMLVAVMCCGYAVGSLLAALLGKQFIESFGWQYVFFAAAVPVVLVPFILKRMPESLQFLVSTQDNAQLRAIVSQIQPGILTQADQTFVSLSGSVDKAGSVGDLFRDGRGFSTVMFGVASAMGLFMMYAISTWLVKLMALAGHSLGSALNFLLAYNIGGIAGAVVGGWLADRLKIKPVLFVFYALSAVFLLILGKGVQPLYLVVGGVGATTLGTQILCFAYAAQFYPASIRTTGVGFASGVGRIGAIIAPITIGLLVSMKLPMEQNFMVIMVCGVLGALAVAFIDHRVSAPVFGVEGIQSEPR
ncbi:Gentisate transporter [compost metagenome]